MSANDLPTVGYLDQWFRALLAAQAPAAAPDASPVLYTVQGLAAVLSVDVNTVRRWLKTGKPSPTDPRNPDANLRLQAYYFTSEARIPWPALLAYERGEPFDLALLPAPAAPPAPALVVPAMRLAS